MATYGGGIRIDAVGTNNGSISVPSSGQTTVFSYVIPSGGYGILQAATLNIFVPSQGGSFSQTYNFLGRVKQPGNVTGNNITLFSANTVAIPQNSSDVRGFNNAATFAAGLVLSEGSEIEIAVTQNGGALPFPSATATASLLLTLFTN